MKVPSVGVFVLEDHGGSLFEQIQAMESILIRNTVWDREPCLLAAAQIMISPMGTISN